MKWELSDGTVVHLGGRVEGESSLARTLRGDVEDSRAGPGWPKVAMSPPPSGRVAVDFNNPAHVHTWISDPAHCLGVWFVSAPELPPSDAVAEPSNPDVLH